MPKKKFCQCGREIKIRKDDICLICKKKILAERKEKILEKRSANNKIKQNKWLD